MSEVFDAAIWAKNNLRNGEEILDLRDGFYEFEDDLLDYKAIDAVWTFYSAKTSYLHIVPDGRTDLIIRFYVDPTGAINNVVPIVAPPFLVAHSVLSRAHQGYVGIRFKSGSGGTILNTCLRSMVGRLFEGQAALTYAPELRDLQREYRNVQCLLEFLNRIFSRQRDFMMSSDVAEALMFIDENTGETRISDLARALGTPVRTFNRRFTNSVGLSPKQYAQIVRLRQAIHLLTKDGVCAADVAADCGFSDQAHMTRDMKRFMGHTPQRLNSLAQDGNLLS